MLKFNRVMCVLLVCVCVGVVYARTYMVLEIEPVGLGEIENDDGEGAAFLKFSRRDHGTHVWVRVYDFLPDTMYFVTVVHGIVRASMPTDAEGDGRLHRLINFDVFSLDPNPDVIIWRDDNGDFTRSTDEHRAIGVIDDDDDD